MSDFIKHKGQIPVNLDHVMYFRDTGFIDPSEIENSDKMGPYYIEFVMDKSTVKWWFKTEKEQQEVYQNILKLMDAV